jgi:hypothetical protein
MFEGISVNWGFGLFMLIVLFNGGINDDGYCVGIMLFLLQKMILCYCKANSPSYL